MQPETLLTALAEHAKTQPQKEAISLLASRDVTQIDTEITYQQLFEKATALAALLQTKATSGERALLCYPTGIDFVIAFYACLMAKIIAVPVVVPSNVGLIKKFTAIYQDCQPQLILTDANTQTFINESSLVQKHIEDYPALVAFSKENNTQVLTTDTIEHAQPTSELNSLPFIEPEDLAFLQYTSGSTSAPKGVMVSHGNLLANIQKMTQAYGISKDSVGLSWLPHTHDMGLIGVILQANHIGIQLFLTNPLSFIRNPMSWLRALSEHKVNTTACPCFALKMCMDRANRADLTQLDLSHLKCLIVGSEPIADTIVKRFFQTFSNQGLNIQSFAPSYGLAENTLMASCRYNLSIKALDYQALKKGEVALRDSSPHQDNAPVNAISCGQPAETVKIVDPKHLTLCRPHEVGEIWLQGDSVTQGYWNRPEETQHTFQAAIKGESGHFFRTGDLGFIHEGELYITGRLKELIIINGLNYYPQDIEQTVLNSAPELTLASCAAFSLMPPGEETENFVVLIKPAKKLDANQEEQLTIIVKKQILKEYQLTPYDVRFVNLSFPKTTSGKLQRTACAQLYLEQLTLPA